MQLTSLTEFVLPPPPPPLWEAVYRLATSFLQIRVKSQHAIISHMADLLVQWHSRRTVKQKKREETESGGEIERF